MRAPEECPVCGAEVPPKALACPECGADERTGWGEEEADFEATGYEEDSFDYEDFLEKEGLKEGSRPRGIAPGWWVLAIFALVAFVWLVVGGIF